MIANTAFLAALTVFLLAAWLAGELRFLAHVQRLSCSAQRHVHRGNGPARVSEPLCRVLPARAVVFPARDRAQADASGPRSHRLGRRP